jgi:hypothetical protein
MKKIGLTALLISFMGLWGVPTFAAFEDNCGTTILDLDGTQDPWDDEFLYTVSKHREKAIKDADIENPTIRQDQGAKYKIGSYMLECDKEICPNGSLAYLGSGGYFGEGSSKTATKGIFFQCDTSGGDKWVKVGDVLPDCRTDVDITRNYNVYFADANSVKNYQNDPSLIYFRYRYYASFCKCGKNGMHFEPNEGDPNNGKCVKDEEKEKAKQGMCESTNKIGFALTDAHECSYFKNQVKKGAAALTGDTCDNICLQDPKGGWHQHIVIHSCKSGQTPNKEFPKSVLNMYNEQSQKSLAAHIYKCEDKVDPVKPEKKEKTCEESYKGNDEAIACCKFKYSNWQNGQCVCDSKKARWIYDSKNKTGFCKNESKKPEKPGKQPGKQPDKQPDAQPEQTPVTPVVTEEDCYYTLDIDVKCSNGKKFHKGDSVKLTKEQVNKIGGCDKAQDIAKQSIIDILQTAKQEYTAYIEFIKLVCGDNATSISPISTGPSNDDVSDAVRTLEKFTSNASNQASVWKDADGNFNTARLASDLTAAVVLGTVGGVVSGVVIKKKQIGKGFEVLNCTVGGHKVAGWGDTFRVGLE